MTALRVSLLCVTTFALGLVAGYSVRPRPQPPADLDALLGRTEAEAVALLGEPDVKNTAPPPGLDYTTWNYNESPHAPRGFYLILRVKDGRVVYVVLSSR
jgi:hypothetical protein